VPRALFEQYHKAPTAASQPKRSSYFLDDFNHSQAFIEISKKILNQITNK